MQRKETAKALTDKYLAEIQMENCAGCKYADSAKVGTGEACCTYIRLTRWDHGKCLDRKPIQP